MSDAPSVRPAGWLDVSRRETISGVGTRVDSSSVFCQFEEKTVDGEKCDACGFLDGVARDSSGVATAVLCSRDRGERGTCDVPTPAVDGSTSFDLSTPLSELMTRRVTCVTADVSVDVLRRLFLENGYGTVPVIGTDGKPLGVVTKTDLLRDFDSSEGFAGRSRVHSFAGEVMSRAVVSLPEEAPASRAAAVMAYEGIQHVVVVSATDGSVIGMLSSSDVMRALGRRAGYRLPDRDRRRQAR